MEEIRPGVKLETREYGDAATAPALVVWGHGLCNALVGESTEKLWDFWATMTPRRKSSGDDGDGDGAGVAVNPTIPADDDAAMHVVRYAARGHGESSPADSPTDCTWEALGRDMLTLGQRLRRGPEQKMVLGGASMGSASAIYAAVHALNDAACGGVGESSSSSSSSSPPAVISGLVLVILPTFYETRQRRKGQIVKATERGFAAIAEKKGVRPIFKGTPRESEPPQPLGVREDSFQQVMLGGAESDLPPPEVSPHLKNKTTNK